VPDVGPADVRTPFGAADRVATVGDAGKPATVGSADIRTLTLRRDFLAANAGKRAPMPGFVLLVHDRGDGDPAIRVGFTVTKKIGNAVVRNRMKRRLRALARELLPAGGIRGADHVLIGRDGGIERDHGLLKAEFAKALGKIARGEDSPSRPRGPRKARR
jgi:ribonuclease P protein component